MAPSFKKVSNPGASLSPGQTIVTMTQGDYVWVDANFKETQLKDVKPASLPRWRSMVCRAECSKPAFRASTA